MCSRLNARNDDSLDKKKRLLKAMKNLVKDINDEPGTKDLGDDLIDYSLTFSWYATQVALVDGLTFGLALAFPVAFVVLCFATSNLVLAFYAMVTIGLIVASVLGTVYLIGWNLGIKESVAGVVVIGFSVDYTIHLGHMFDVARSQGLTTRQEKFAYSIRKMGETVLAGAITTAGSTVFLLACQLTFFTAMGTLIILTVAYSLGYSLLFFMPLLRIMGPEGRVGDICHFLRGLKCACCRRA